ncbi:MAG: serine/threonine protein kinase, partial [Myxococcaceae bacterium]|nr:serine/threonine protein kinase [Myxococcaceae bacterium]
MWAADQLVLNGRFKILSPLGKGAFSEAYLAEQVGLSRKVVVKTLSAQLGHDLDGRFGAEVRALAAVDHPSVVRVLDFGVGDGVVFVVTEHVEGTSLAKAIGTEPFLPDRALALFGQLAEGLGAIHARGLVHLGLSADTVFLAQTPLGERARMADFGVARLLDPATEGSRLTAVLAPVQHRVYQSPEQAMGAPTDARSDLFVLGILGYQMLSGRLPFAAPQAPADVPQAGSPVPLAEAAPHLKDHPRLVELVMRCLEKDPAARPQQALELVQRLTAVPEVGEPTILMEAYQGLPPALPLRPAAAPAR